MPKVRNVAKHLSIEVAKGERTCHTNSNHKIAAGEAHLAQETRGVRENICKLCAGDVLDTALAHLATLRTGLGL